MKSVLKNTLFRMMTVFLIAVSLLLENILFLCPAIAQQPTNNLLPPSVLSIPRPSMPALLGLSFYLQDPWQFDFYVHPGTHPLAEDQFSAETEKLIKYFMTALTMPEDRLWVNLSFYEKDRVIPQHLGETRFGQDLLEQDYLLKKLSMAYLSPENEWGKRFWEEINALARKQFNADLPVDIYHRIWVIPDKAVIHEAQNSVFIVNSHLKVMLEGDVKALKRSFGVAHDQNTAEKTVVELNEEAARLMREIILPEIEKKINTDDDFTPLRQIYNAVILASWYKSFVKESFLNQQYTNREKIEGIDSKDKSAQDIYNKYLKTFQEGAFDLIREEYDPQSQEVTTKKYFSGGVDYAMKTEQFDKAASVDELAILLDESRQAVIKFDVIGDKSVSVASNAKARQSQPEAYSQRVNAPQSWEEVGEDYQPPSYTSPKVIEQSYENFTTEEMTENPEIGWGDPEDVTKVKSFLPSFHGVIAYNEKKQPLNPMGPTGLAGRGLLGRWGVNRAVDPIVTRHDKKTGKLQVLAILRRDALQWAIPGGFENRGEATMDAMNRELKEETGILLDMRQGKKIYEGYIDDPRSTDNAWIETVSYHLHLPYDQSLQLVVGSKNEAVVGAWVDVDHLLNGDQIYASHGALLREVIKKYPLEKKDKLVVKENGIKPHPVVLKYKNKLNFQAATYADFVSDLSPKGLKEFEAALRHEFFNAVKDYQMSEDWNRRISSDYLFVRNEFRKSDESYLGNEGALVKNGFYESQEYFVDRILRRFILGKVIKGPHQGEWAPIYLDVNASEGTGIYAARQKARNLFREGIERVFGEFLRGRAVSKDIKINFFRRAEIRLRTSFLASFLEEVIMFFMPLSMMSGLTYYFHPEGGIKIFFLELMITFALSHFIFKPAFKKVQNKFEKNQVAFYESLFDGFVYGITPAIKKNRQKDFYKAIHSIDRNHPGNSILLNYAAGVVYHGLSRSQSFTKAIRVANAFAASPLKIDKEAVVIGLLKTLADENPEYYEEFLVNHPYNLQKIISLVNMQSTKVYLNYLAEKNVEEVLGSTAARQLDDYSKQPAYQIEVNRLSTTDRYMFLDQFYANFLKNMREEITNPEDRRNVILAYFVGGGLSRLQAVYDAIQRGSKVNSAYYEMLNFTAKVHWLAILREIREEEKDLAGRGLPSVYGLSVDEISQIIEDINKWKEHTLAESLHVEVFDKVDPEVYRGIMREIQSAYQEKAKADPRHNMRVNMEQYRSATPRLYTKLFKNIMMANPEYFQELAGIFHDTGASEEVRIDVKRKEFYLKSLNIDTRLFDPDFNAATAEELADTLSLVDHLGKSNESVEVYLGNLFYKGFTPGPKDDNKARIKLVHLKAVNEFFNNEISFGELKEKLYHFYRLTSKGINGENQLHHSLTLKIGQSLEKLQLLKSLYEEHKNVERLFKDDVDVYSKAELSRKLIELQLRIDEVKNQMDVIIDPQTAPWAYLVAGIPRFGEKARERREWLLSNEDPVVGIIGLLQNGDLFADIDNNSLEDYWNKNEPETSQAEFFSHFDKQDDPKNILKVRRLLRYYHALLAMDSYSFPGEKDPTYRSFDAIAEMSSLLVNSWEDLKTFIDELGLEKDPRFEGMLHVGNRLAQTSATGIKYGGLGDVMSTSLDRAVSTSASPVIFEEVGGIDLNSQFIDFERIGSSSQAIFPGQFMQTEPAVFNGLKPVIIRITPVINIPQLLGASS